MKCCHFHLLPGICVVYTSLAPAVYISDICEKEIRGTLSATSQIMFPLGILFSYVLGSLVNWKWLAIGSGFIPFFFMIAMMAVPESPRYLLDKDQEDEAVEALCWLRGTTVVAEVQDEIHMVNKPII